MTFSGKVSTVTITGADDATDPEDLLALSREFPSVEWAILISKTRDGLPRYPSAEWIRKLRVAQCWRRGADRMQLAAHLCGEVSRRLQKGDRTVVTDHFLTFFQRIQLNGYEFTAAARETHAVLQFARENEVFVPFSFILQTRNDTDLEAAAQLIARSPTNRVEVLYDPSGGTGLRTASWPVAPSNVRLGYAGGIGPDNVGEVLAATQIATILAAQRDGADRTTWIDMESRVRTDDRLDLKKVRYVLQTHADHLARSTIVTSVREGRRS